MVTGKDGAGKIIETLSVVVAVITLSGVVRQFGRMCIRMVRFCRFADALRMLG